MNSYIRAILPIVALSIACAGCKSGDASIVTANHSERPSVAEKGWQEVRVSGVAVSLPPDVVPIDLSSKEAGNISNVVKNGFPNNPEVAGMVTQAMANGHMKMMALEAHASSPKFRNNLNLIILDAPKGMSIDTLFQASLNQIKSMPSSAPATGSVVDLPAGKASHIQAHIVMGALKYDINSYVLIHGGKQYAFTYSNSPSTADKWNDIAEKSIKSLSFTD